MKFTSIYKNYTLGTIQFKDGIYETEIESEIEVLTKDSSVSKFVEDTQEIEKLRVEKENAEKVAEEIKNKSLELEQKFDAIVEKTTNRLIELFELGKDGQVLLISELCKGKEDIKIFDMTLGDIVRGSASIRVKAILELEKGL